MTEDQKEQLFAQRIKSILDDVERPLDTDVRRKLAAERNRALAAIPQGRNILPWMVPAGAAAAMILSLLIWQQWAANPSAALMVVDLEILLSEEELQMVEDLEFIQWLEVTNVGDKDEA